MSGNIWACPIAGGCQGAAKHLTYHAQDRPRNKESSVSKSSAKGAKKLGKQSSVKFTSKALGFEGPGSNPGSNAGKWPDLSVFIRKTETTVIILVTPSWGYFKS